jgi:hypothetical protein
MFFRDALKYSLQHDDGVGQETTPQTALIGGGNRATISERRERKRGRVMLKYNGRVTASQQADSHTPTVNPS